MVYRRGGVPQFARQDSDFDLVNLVVLHESSRPENRCRQTKFPNVLLNFPLALPMIDAGVALSSSDGTVDKMFYPSFLCGLAQVFALLHFTSSSNRPEILHTLDTVNTSCGALEGGRIFQISLHQFDALAG